MAFFFGCTSSPAAQPEPSAAYRPPTIVALTPLVLMPSPTNADSSTTLVSTVTPGCSNDLRFLEDITVPDGTQVAPGETIEKSWRVENTGTCNWNELYRLRLVAGSDLSASSEQALYPARSGTQAIIRSYFIAPSEPGIHRSAWQACDPEGNLFGDTIFIQIVVANP